MAAKRRPNILLMLNDQRACVSPYESNELRRFRREVLTAETSLHDTGVCFDRHYIMSVACTPSRTSIMTGQYPSLHGVTQTDGLAKSADGEDATWLAADTVPTIGDWFRAGGYRAYYKGKWHVSHSHLPGPDGTGVLQTLDKKGKVIPENVEAYLKADLLDEFGFSEWVGPEAHGLGPQNTGEVRDPFTADETIEMLKRLDMDGDERPWMMVTSYLNPHDICLFGVVALAQGLRYDRSDDIPPVPEPPTQHEDLSTKPDCQQSYVDNWGKMLAPQPWIETNRRFYYQSLRSVDRQMQRVLDALKETDAYENTIVIFTSDHGEMLGAHGGMHEKWHNAYEETTRVPFVVAGPPVANSTRHIDAPSSHADLLPTMLGLAGIDQKEAFKVVAKDHRDARPLPGRDLSKLIMDRAAKLPADAILFMTDDEISEGKDKPGSPFQRWAMKTKTYQHIVQPNHVETVVARLDIDGSLHTVKLSRYHDNQQFWTEPGLRDERLRKKKTVVVTEPEADQYELYDLTLDPMEQHNLAHPVNADDRSRNLQERMTKLLIEQLAAKRLVPATGVRPGYRPPVL